MLTVNINSFSYIYNGIPGDKSGNGGGFVFDCRFISNPGRHPDLMVLTGKNELVIRFLDGNKEMQLFLKNCFSIIDSAVENYYERDFTNLMVSFGCTGGRHRSVYAAEKLYQHLTKKFNKKISVSLKHINID